MRSGDLQDVIRKRPKDIKNMSTMVQGKDGIRYHYRIDRKGRAQITGAVDQKNREVKLDN